MAIYAQTLCWDCKNATGTCSWSDELIPVKGWRADRIEKEDAFSYLVFDCPEFVRDAKYFGTKRLTAEDKEYLAQKQIPFSD